MLTIFSKIFFLIQVWQHQALYHCQSPITAVSTTKLSILSPASNILVAQSDSSIRCLSHDGLKEVAVTSLNSSCRHDEPLNKYMKTSSTISFIDISWLGCLFLVSDTRGNLYVYKLLPEGSPITLGYGCTLLEYCLLTGLDWLDLLLCLRSNVIEALCERFDTSFNRQPLPVQQYHYRQFLCIKISLYR